MHRGIPLTPPASSMADEEAGVCGANTLRKLTKAAESRHIAQTSSSDCRGPAPVLSKAGGTNERAPPGSGQDPAVFHGFIYCLHKDPEGEATRFAPDKAEREG